jgi:hypothetical protein
MVNRDYVLRMFEMMGRILAQVIYRRELKDYEAAHELIEEQLKQTLGMGRGFIYSLSDDMLLSLLSTTDKLNADKCWQVAVLLKIDGEIYEDQQNEIESFQSYRKACMLFLETLLDGNQSKEFEPVSEIEETLSKLKDYELPLRTQQLLFWYFDATNRFGLAEDMLFDILETPEHEVQENIEEFTEMLERGEAFYARLLGKSDAELATGNFSQEEIGEGLERLHQLFL